MSLRRSFILSFVEKYSSLVITFISSIIIARLLTPSEIGIFSVTVAFTTIAHMLRDFGVGDYLIKEKTLTRQKVGTVFSIAIVFAWSMGIALFLLAPHISKFYEEIGIEKVLSVLCISFFLIPFSSPILPLLRRRMEFEKLLRINLSSNSAYAISATMLAYNGFSYMSLAWASLIATTTTFLLAQYYRPEEAKVFPCIGELKPVLSFGGTISLGMLVSELGKNSPQLIIGKMLEFSSVGLYGRAEGLVNMVQRPFFQAIHPVFHSEFAARIRNGEDIATTYLKGISYVEVIIWPLFCYIGFFSEQIIIILFGYQWVESAPVASILCVGAFIWTLWGLAPKAIVAGGHATKILQLQVIVQTFRIILTGIGALFSLKAIAFMYCVVMVIALWLHTYYLKKLFGISASKVVWASRKSLTVTAISFCSCVLIYNILDGFVPEFVALAISTLAMFVTWIASIYLTHHSFRQELETIKFRRS